MKYIILLLLVIASISCQNKQPEIYGKWEKVRYQELYEGKYYDIDNNLGGKVAVVFTDSNTINVIDFRTNRTHYFDSKWRVSNDTLFKKEDTCIILKMSKDSLIVREENQSIFTYCRIK